ncbi:MAG: ribbon-helix-helix protein, CopG family [Methylococcaceae bacterium]|nr:ribbon-helix-helix protein, CopG family [Methylococcaceae bacterium]
MTTITLDEQLNKQFNLLANQAHISIDQAVNDALREYLADYSDALLAENALDELSNNEDELID